MASIVLGMKFGISGIALGTIFGYLAAIAGFFNISKAIFGETVFAIRAIGFSMPFIALIYLLSIIENNPNDELLAELTLIFRAEMKIIIQKNKKRRGSEMEFRLIFIDN